MKRRATTKLFFLTLQCFMSCCCKLSFLRLIFSMHYLQKKVFIVLFILLALLINGCGKSEEGTAPAVKEKSEAQKISSASNASNDKKADVSKSKSKHESEPVKKKISKNDSAAKTVEQVTNTPSYIIYKKRAEYAKELPLERYKSKLAPPYKSAIVTNAPYCKEPGIVFMQGEIISLEYNPMITNRYTAMQAARANTNLHYTCIYRTIDGRLWYLYPDNHSALLSNGSAAFMKVNIYGKIDEKTGLVKVKSYISGGRHFQWDEEKGEMFAPEFSAKMLKSNNENEEKEEQEIISVPNLQNKN